MGAMHSQMPASWLMGVPGLKIVAPSDPASAYGLLRGGDPRRQPRRRDGAQDALFGEGSVLGSVPIPPGRAHVVREGDDLSIIATMRGTLDAVEAAERLSAEHGIEPR